MAKDKRGERLTGRSLPVVRVERAYDADEDMTTLGFAMVGDPCPFCEADGIISALQEVGGLACDCMMMPHVGEVIESGPATVIKFTDGTKSVAICGDGDEHSRDMGLMVAAIKRQGVGHDLLCQLESAARMASALPAWQMMVIGTAMVIAANAKVARDEGGE